MNGDLYLITKLVSNGANIDAQGENKCTALILSIKAGYTSCVKYLLDQGANPDVKEEHGRVALTFASMVGDATCVKYLLEHNANPNIHEEHDRSALICAATSRKLACVRYLLDYNAKLGFADRSQVINCALASPPNFEMIIVLVTHGLDPNTRHVSGKTCLIMAIEANHATCVRHLLSYGADIFPGDSGGQPNLQETLNLIYKKNIGRSNNFSE